MGLELGKSAELVRGQWRVARFGQDTRRQVVNLSEVIDHKGQPSIRRRGDWVPVARQRGIEQIVLAFLDEVRAGRQPSARDALRTHELCERVITDALTQAAC